MTDYFELRQDGGLVVRLHRRVLAGMQRESAAEFDGVLLGTQPEETREILVEDYAPLPAGENRHSLPVIGYFRVGAGGDTRIEDVELDQFKRHFPQPLALFLLFRRSDDRLVWSDAYVQPGAVEAAAPVAASDSPLREQAPPPRVEPPQRPASKRRLWPALAAVAVGAIIGAAYVMRSDHSTPSRYRDTAAVPKRARPPLADWKPVDPRSSPATTPVGPSSAHRDSPFEADRSVDTASAGPPENRAEVQRDIRNLLEQWRDSMLHQDVDTYTSLYAPSVGPYFHDNRVTRAQVGDEVRRTLSRYGPLSTYKISDITIAPVDESHAIANFRKEWRTARNNFAGAEKSQLRFVRQNGQWKIASEQELKVYWVRKK
jgi:hypothetical protein